MLRYTRHVFKLRCAANITLESGHVVMALHMWLWQYTCGYGTTHVVMAIHMWLWHYTCGYGNTHVVMALHMWLWQYTCGYGNTHVVMAIHMWLWQYTFSGRVYGLNLFSGMGDPNLDLLERIPKYTDKHKRQPRADGLNPMSFSVCAGVSWATFVC